MSQNDQILKLFPQPVFKYKVDNFDKINIELLEFIYKEFEKSLNIKKDFAVAVSGGPDSLALTFLAKVYSLKNKLHSKFFIVDHKLRPQLKKQKQ